MPFNERGLWTSTTIDERGRAIFGSLDERGQAVFGLNTGGIVTTKDGSATLIGIGTLSASGNIIKDGSTSLVGLGLMTATGIREVLASASLIGSGVLIADIHEIVIVDAQASLIGNGVLFANGTNGLIWRTIDGEVIPMYEATQETVNNWETPEITVILFK